MERLKALPFHSTPQAISCSSRFHGNPAFLFAPAHCHMQRASAVATLGAIMAEEGLAKPGNAFELIYLRKSQAEREREARLAKEEAGE